MEIFHSLLLLKVIQLQIKALCCVSAFDVSGWWPLLAHPLGEGREEGKEMWELWERLFCVYFRKLGHSGESHKKLFLNWNVIFFPSPCKFWHDFLCAWRNIVLNLHSRHFTRNIENNCHLLPIAGVYHRTTQDISRRAFERELILLPLVNWNW